MQAKRITVFAGHYGSGKTTLALNYAIWLKAQGKKAVLCDLDIVNPYYRTADAAQELEAQGIPLIASAFANTNVDAPALPPQARAIFDDTSLHAVIDLGGDDRGALAMGRYAKLLRAENDYEMLMVVNQYRPLTRNLEDLSEIRQEIEAAAKVPFTGIVNNSNLGEATQPQDITATYPFAQEVAHAMQLPLRMTAVEETLMAGLSPPSGGELFPVKIFKKSIWRI